jgi:hypothetical protein
MSTFPCASPSSVACACAPARKRDSSSTLTLHPDERRAQRDLGLAEAHVAADHAVHRPGGAQIVDHLADGGELVSGLLEGKALLEGVQLLLVNGERVSGPGRAP